MPFVWTSFVNDRYPNRISLAYIFYPYYHLQIIAIAWLSPNDERNDKIPECIKCMRPEKNRCIFNWRLIWPVLFVSEYQLAAIHQASKMSYSTLWNILYIERNIPDSPIDQSRWLCYNLYLYLTYTLHLKGKYVQRIMIITSFHNA